MSTPNPNPLGVKPPSLSALTARYLGDSHRDFAAEGGLETSGVELHEAPSGFRTDARMAWAEALVSAQSLAGPFTAPSMPTSWGNIGRGLPPRFAIPMCVGNYPQLLTDPLPLFSEPDLARLLRPGSPLEARPAASPLHLSEPARKANPELGILVAAAGHRLSGDLAAYETTLRESEQTFLGRWRSVWDSEQAVVHWEYGRFEEAEAIWNRLPDGLTRSYNLGLASLFRNDREAARHHLTAACDHLPDSSGWMHLTSLYITRLA